MSAYCRSTVPSIYFNKNILTIDIPKVYLYNSIKSRSMHYYLSTYTNVLLKTAYIGTQASIKYSLTDTVVTTIDFRQIMNIPSGEYVKLTTNLEDDYKRYLDSIILDAKDNRVLVDNFSINLNVNNDCGELFGYCNQLVDVTFERK